MRGGRKTKVRVRIMREGEEQKEGERTASKRCRSRVVGYMLVWAWWSSIVCQGVVLWSGP